MKKIYPMLMLLSFPAWGQTPTVVFGASQTAPGEADSFLLTQPADSGNPLGDPIVVPFRKAVQMPEAKESVPLAEPTSDLNTSESVPSVLIRQSATQDPPPFSEKPTAEQNQIQNTLYEGGNRIYDVQSYPIGDIKTITTPNLDPTITRYPEY